MQKWDYKSVLVEGPIASEPDAALKLMGDDGWELVAVRPANGVVVEVWYFKRARK